MTPMTSAEETLFDTTAPTAAEVRDACLSVHDLPTAERYRRVTRIAQRVAAFAPDLHRAVLGFQAFGLDAAAFRALAC